MQKSDEDEHCERELDWIFFYLFEDENLSLSIIFLLLFDETMHRKNAEEG